ncbi:uncharacterized protein LOC130793639 [Actinidia eriantha]|uniref:uncharacterized protein LOC130793639 n=1 Tax=Actinidia eriantha TaxID=165200 RepID=UPI002588D78E|nr:uncharacterized protein LOC130793639 [Actinidia eriantha]
MATRFRRRRCLTTPAAGIPSFWHCIQREVREESDRVFFANALNEERKRRKGLCCCNCSTYSIRTHSKPPNHHRSGLQSHQVVCNTLKTQKLCRLEHLQSIADNQSLQHLLSVFLFSSLIRLKEIMLLSLCFPI